MREIVLEGAREHNLKDVSLRIPKGKLTVFTGVSGSGKSSIAFDTIAVESQRQLNETFSWFIRNRLPRYERPKADFMRHLSATVVVDQKPLGGNARSTVGTMTEIQPILRVLFSRHGKPFAGPANFFSFNDPQGMCPRCEGLGRTVELDLARLLDESKSLNEGAIRFPAFAVGGFQWQLYATTGLFDPDKPIRDFTKDERELFLHGSGFKVDREGRNKGRNKGSKDAKKGNEYEGVVRRFTRRYLKSGLDNLKDADRRDVETVVTAEVCSLCGGGRLSQEALACTIDGKNIADYCAMEVAGLIPELDRISDPTVRPVAEAAIEALRRVERVGLGYLSLDRETSTVSGGEGHRLKTVRHLGSSLSDLTYVFDEPSTGLHPRDVARLNELLIALRDKGNTVLVVEHDRDVIAIADHVIDVGPGAGTHGGRIVFEGTVAQLRRAQTTTGQRMREIKPLKPEVRKPSGTLPVRGAKLHNLHDVDADFPAGVLTVVTGVAGSGKSSLVKEFSAGYAEAVLIDQSGIGVSARSTPATYVDIMDPIRVAFGRANDAEPGWFSFNSLGACPQCHGRGEIRTDLAYLDPVTTTCDLCGGQRYRAEVLEYKLDGRTIVEVLDLTVEEALEAFGPPIRDKLALLAEVGLSYLTLGQPLSTLSGGERQRLKLAHRLNRSGSVYLFDEPSAGLHMADLDLLLALLDRLVDDGNTVIVIEHDLDVIKHADWVIDLGPEAGADGGRIVFAGTPADLTRAQGSHTADYLNQDLNQHLGSSRSG